MRKVFPIVCGLCLLFTAHTPAGSPPAPSRGNAVRAAAELQATAHPPLPADADGYWLVPTRTWKPGTPAARAAAAALARAAALLAEKKPQQALPLIDVKALSATPLHAHAVYTKGLAELRLGRAAASRRTLATVRTMAPSAALAERAAIAEAEAAEAAGDLAGALAIYQSMDASAVASATDVLSNVARVATAAGDHARATAAWQRLYFEYPSSDAGVAAISRLSVQRREPMTPGSARFTAELARAERLFADRRYADARDGYMLVLPHTTGDQQDLVSLRLAACDYFTRRYAAATSRLKPLLDRAARRDEIQFYYLSTVRHTGTGDAYEALVRRMVVEHPASSWTEDALNNLASSFIIQNEDQKADAVFREVLARFPTGRHAARAGWKVGWWAYKHGRYEEAASVFDRSAGAFPRSDYRPPWLYWSARARERLAMLPVATDRYRLVVVDYANSYYGRLASARLKALKAAPASADVSPARWQSPGNDALPAIPTADLMAWLMHAGLYEAALDEVNHVRRTWPRTPALEATRAWLLNRTGKLRPGISAMRQTYPHVLAAGGESLPLDIQKVVFPLEYWPQIKQYATANRLDPYLVAALVAQESTFDPQIRSTANAIGLMQILPTTGRQWARKLSIRPYSTGRLTTPAVNIRIGTAYFADLLRRFGGVPYALAGYNAGDNRVARWMAERPGLPLEEFIDDIPFPETQNYVKRILGTAEDYRRLYGGSRDPERAPAMSRR